MSLKGSLRSSRALASSNLEVVEYWLVVLQVRMGAVRVDILVAVSTPIGRSGIRLLGLSIVEVARAAVLCEHVSVESSP